jgi:FkbM family methyltransferase
VVFSAKIVMKRVFEAFGLGFIRKRALDSLMAISDPFVEQRRLVKREDVTIVDVGAHVGNVTKKYNELFPHSFIYAFEPFPPTFAKLKANLRGHSNVRPINLGLADRRGKLPFHSNTFAATNSLLPPDPAADATWGADVVKADKTVDCEFTTLDEFASENQISYIDVLKLDAQGAEPQIMDGAKKLVESSKIGLVYTEIITMPTYKRQKALWEVLKQFDDCGFGLHNVYNLDLVEGRLRQVEAIFVKP